MMKFFAVSTALKLGAVTAACLTAGCAGVSALNPGATQAEVRAAWGAPTLTQLSANGQRWAYSTAPEGRRVWLLDFDASGKLLSQVQGLTLDRVSRVQIGLTQTEVEALLGPSYFNLRYPFKQEELVHIYRFQNGQIATCFYVGYNTAGVVSSTGMGDENVEPRRYGLMRPC